MARLPTAINLHKASKTLTLTYAPGEAYNLPAEFLRVHSPSASVSCRMSDCTQPPPWQISKAVSAGLVW